LPRKKPEIYPAEGGKQSEHRQDHSKSRFLVCACIAPHEYAEGSESRKDENDQRLKEEEQCFHGISCSTQQNINFDKYKQ